MEATSYQKFLQMYYNEHQEMSKEESSDSNDTQDEDNNAEEGDDITKLCRVCGSRGMIYIFSVVCEKYLTIGKNRLSKFQDVTIAEMIESISSEKVEKTDLLPQFICPHCLSYLQHAYNIRLEIKHTSNNLREARKIANDEPLPNQSIALETSMTVKPLSLNQKEIIDFNDEIEGDRYWHETFGKTNAKLKISSPAKARIDQRKAEEYKCPGCFRKQYGAKSHNSHMKNCLTNVLKNFFSEFQQVYKARFEKKITQEEYLISTISLIFNYIKKIEIVAKKDNIDIESISKLSPKISDLLSCSQSVTKPSTQNNNRTSTDRFASPDDYGYFSNTQ